MNNMKSHLWISLILYSFGNLFAQNPSAILDLESNTQGVLVPRTDTALVNASHIPATGLLIFQNSDAAFYYYNGSSWVKVGGEDGDTDPTNEIETWATLEGIPAGFSDDIDHVDDADSDPTNEAITSLIVTGDSLSITEGGASHRIAVDSSNSNEIQSLQVSPVGDTLSLIKGNYVIIPGVSEANYHVQERLNLGATPIQLFDDGVPIDSLYGKVYLGGLIFYLNTSTGEGFVASATDLTDREWGCEGSGMAVGAFCQDLGCGDTNTDAIIAGCLVGTTAAEEARAYDDGTSWFLPSREELLQMRNNLHLNGYGNFTIDGLSYWSSSESNNSQAEALLFNGSWNILNKSSVRHVRAVKAF